MDFIYEEENVIPDYLCKKLIEIYEQNEEHHTEGMISHQGRPQVVKSLKDNKELYLDGYLHKSEIELLHDLCMNTIGNYVEYLKINSIDKCNSLSTSVITKTLSQTNTLSYPQIQKNVVGSFFDWHVDFSPLVGQCIHCIMYLNDIGCVGGETEFSTGRVIKPKMGKMLIFPTTFFHVHRGRPILKGEKYIASVFFNIKQPEDKFPIITT